jgi:hypothetical protein
MLRLHAARLFALLTTLALPACGEPPDATTEATADGSGSGSGSEGVATCWLDGVPVEKCPVQPRGNLPADCPSGRVFESADFAPGTGPCVPSMPDWDCPEGWRSVPGFTDGSGNEDVPEGMPQFSICEPPEGSAWVGAPEGSGTVGAPELPPTPTDCPAGTIAVPGDAACRPMGSPCPTAAERWASEADLRARAPGYTGPVVYVAADAATDGAGTRASPRPLGSAAVRAAQNGLLALALGDYPSGVRLDRKVALLGACVAGTTVRSSLPFADAGILDLVGGGAALVRDLTLSGSRPGITVTGTITEPHRIEAVTMREATGIGLYLSSAQAVEGRDLRIEDTAPLADGTFGGGIVMSEGAALTLTGATLRNNHTVGLFADGIGTSVLATGLLVEDTQPQVSDQTRGWGIGVQEGAALTLSGATLRNNHDVGLFAGGAGATVEATGLLVEDTQPQVSDQTRGWGIGVLRGASLNLTGATLRNNHAQGLFADGVGTTVEATGLLVENTQPQVSDQTVGWGIGVQRGAALTLTGATLRNNHAQGLFAARAGATVEATGLLVENTQPQVSDQTGGRGIGVQEGAALTLTGATLRNNHDVGLFADGVGTTVEATGLLVENTQPQASDQTGGGGISAQLGAALALTGATLRNNHDSGLFAGGAGATVEATGLLVENTQPQVSDQTAGWGIGVQEGAALTLTGATLRNNHYVGLAADGVGTTVAATGLLVADTQPDAGDQTWGAGVLVYDGAALTLTGAILRNNHYVGLAAGGVGTTVAATGLLLADTQPQVSDQAGGRGIAVQEGASLTLTGATLRNNHDVGLFAADSGTTVEATGLLVEDTQPQASDRSSGRGIGVQLGASLTLTGATLRNNHDSGLFAGGVGTTIEAAGLLITDTQPQASDGLFGDGLLVLEGASLTGTDITLWENARCGLQMAFEGVSVAVQGALIGRNQIGTNLQSSDFTRDDLAVGVRGESYWENGLDIGAESLPIPDPLAAFESLVP